MISMQPQISMYTTQKKQINNVCCYAIHTLVDSCISQVKSQGSMTSHLQYYICCILRSSKMGHLFFRVVDIDI